LKAQVGQVESDTAAQAEQVGAQYAQDTMDNLDSAQDPKGIIDALRGNQKPLEDRYMELAQYVGQDDAMKTPESVLAMVQPTLMMTEQGAVDTGIGELMQGITSDVSMETPDGQPTQMAEGVGSLMMQGVGQQPTQNFRQGGPVVYMQVGGDPRLQQIFSQMLPTYESAMGSSADAKNAAQMQALGAIAEAGLNLAAGRNSRGESTAGQSFAAGLAGAAQGLPSTFGKIASDQRAGNQQVRLAALGAAQGEYTAELAAARAAAKDTFSLTTLYGADGKPVTINTGNAEGRARATGMVDEKGFTTVAPKEKKFEAVMFYKNNEDGTVEQKMVNVGTANGIDMRLKHWLRAALAQITRKLPLCCRSALV
jgi:hypothetical protein